MSMYKKCDGYDCNNFEWNCVIYDIDCDDISYIEKLLSTQIDYPYEHLCSDCIEYINVEYPKDKPLLIIVNDNKVTINKDYIDE